MLKVIVIFCILATVWADDADINEKYIDLLPEEEKQEFLDRIARRILEGIQSDDTPNDSHVEINDDQLAKHDDFVQNIINEESTNFKNKKGLEPNKSHESINMTLPEEKRDRRRNDEKQLEIIKDQTYDVIPVKTIYDDYDTMPASNISKSPLKLKDSDNNITDSKKQSKANDKRENIESHLFINTEETQFLNEKNVQINNSSTKERSSIIKVDNYHNNNTKSEFTDFEITTTSSTDNTIETEYTNDVFDTTQGINQTVNEDEKNTNIILTTTDETIKNSEASETDRIKTETISENTTDVMTHEPTLSPRERSDKTIEYHRRGIGIEKNKYSTDIVEMDKMYAQASIATQKNINVTNNFEKNNTESSDDLLKTTQLVENSTREYKSAPSFREGRDISEKESDIAKLNLLLDRNKEYRVYEINSEKNIYTTTQESQQAQRTEQPNYVPVFNYAPENAYFKPFARYIPKLNNDTDSLENSQIPPKKITNPDLQVTNRFFGNKKRYRFKTHDHVPNKKIFSKMHNFLRPIPRNIINRDIYYNPDDYLDVEYDESGFKGMNLRNGRSYNFPDSDDADHPINSDSVKDHIGAVRNLLYLQNIFGYVPDIQRKNQNTLDMKSVKLDFMKSLDVAADYYFERMYSNEDNYAQHRNLPRSKVITPRDNKDPYYTKYGDVVKKIDKLNENSFERLFSAIMTVLKDIIRFNNKALEKYSWLDSTVEIQKAIRKLLDILNKLKHGEHIEINDMELLKFTLYLYKRATTDIEEYRHREDFPKDNIKYRSLKNILPRNRKKFKTIFATKIWKNFRNFIRQKETGVFNKLSIFAEFENLLVNLQNNLYDLHEAIKSIAMITTYKTQNWFNDLKDVYLKKAAKYQLGQVILHFALANLFDSVEHYRREVEVSFKSFIRHHKEVTKNIKEDFVFVLVVLEELHKM